MNKQALDRAVQYIKEWLSQKYNRGDVPGFVAAISHQGEMVMNEANGYADLERELSMEPGHVFRVASHSKTFTATSIMLLVEDGDVRLDDYVVDYLPWLKEHKDDRMQQVTLRQLLSHGAGVIRDGVDADYWHLERSFPGTERFIREMMETSLILDNNIKMKYSNYGYTLLGMVVESVTEQAYNEFVLERIIWPLGLEHTFPEYRPALHQPREGDLVTGYGRHERGRRLPIDAISTHAMAAATGFCSTAADLCAYLTAHMAGSGKLLGDESKKEMQRPEWPSLGGDGFKRTDTEYGVGFFLTRYGERQTFGHSGGFPGCITKTMADPEDGLVVSVLTNAIDGPADEFLSGIYGIIDYFQEHLMGSPAEDVSMLEGSYVSLWAAIDIVADGNDLIAVPVGVWKPFTMTEKLKFVEKHTYCITETDSSGSEGEKVYFHVADGCVQRMTYQGKTFWPRADWEEKMAGCDRVRL